MSAASASGPGLYNVVLVGEVHADDLGTTLSDACSKFYATSSQNRSRFPKIAFFHEDVFEQEVQLQVRAGEKAIKVNVYPLEPPETPMGPRKQYLYDNFVHRSVPFVMTSVYFLLKGLSNLVNVYGAGEDAINALAVSRGLLVHRLKNCVARYYRSLRMYFSVQTLMILINIEHK